MTPTPPDPPSNQDRRRQFDELIAVVVALLGIGSIFFWSLTRNKPSFNLPPLVLSPSPSPSPETTTAPAPTLVPGNLNVAPVPSPTASPSAVASPQPSPTQSPTIVPVPVPLSPQPQASASPEPGPPKAFSDVPADYWAGSFISALSARGIIEGFDDNTFRPNRPITRAEFAALIQKAAEQPRTRDSVAFKDLQADYWARPAIDEAVQMGFLSGYPDGNFRPDQEIPRSQGLVSVVSGLQLPSPDNPADALKVYQDAGTIPKYAAGKIAAATNAGLVVSYPDPKQLNPGQTMTRADASALIYQMLVSQKRLEPIASNYIVRPQ